MDSCPCVGSWSDRCPCVNLTDDLTAVKYNVIVLCNLHTRKMLLSFPAAAHCSSVLLLCCCSAAQVQLVGLCNHWVRLHSCTLPVLLLKLLLWLGLAWVEEFKLSLSLCLELASLGCLEQRKLSKLSKFTSCSYISSLVEEIVDKSSSILEFTTEVSGFHFVNLEMFKSQSVHEESKQ